MNGPTPSGRQLLLLRHAKASWSDETLDDHERPLNRRGKRSAAQIAETLRDRELAPDLVLCSSALRAQETLAAFRSAIPEADIQVERDLYGAGSADLLARCRSLPDDARCVLVVGHNPTTEEFARQLVGSENPAQLAELPTAALVILAFEAAPWSDLAAGRASLVDVVRHPG